MMQAFACRAFVVCALVSSTIGCNGTRSTITAERVTVSVSANRDGSLDVRERWAMRFDGATPRRFERVIRRRTFDRIDRIVAEMDGAATDAKDLITTRRDGSVAVYWPLTPARDVTHTLTLRYHVIGAINVEGTRGVVRWEAIPASRRYAVLDSLLTLAVDGDVERSRTGVAEAGWSVASTADGISATHGPLARNDRATLVGEWRVDPAVVGIPQWQVDADRAAQFAPAYISGALFILVIGAGVIWILRFQHPTSRVRVRDVTPADAGARAPALAAALAQRQRRTPHNAAAGTLLDLGRRGLLGVQWTSRGRLVLRPSDDHALPEHELSILDALRPLASPDGVPARRAAHALRRANGRINRALLTELREVGLVDAERVAVARGLEVSGIVTMVAGMCSALLIGLALTRYGVWPLFMAASIFIVGVALLFAGALFSVLTPAGEDESARWRARRRLTKKDRSPTTAVAWLPLMTAIGQDGVWLRRSISAAAEDRSYGWMQPFEGETRERALRRFVRMLEQTKGAH